MGWSSEPDSTKPEYYPGQTYDHVYLQYWDGYVNYIYAVWKPMVILDFESNPNTDGILIPPDHHLVSIIVENPVGFETFNVIVRHGEMLSTDGLPSMKNFLAISPEGCEWTIDDPVLTDMRVSAQFVGGHN